jgi:diguanylate cyclase (GGDEF)-like protein
MKILVVEDDPTAARIVEQTVRGFGHEAYVVSEAVAAWDALQSNEWRIVISDWMMPGEDGLSLCRRIRASALPFYAYIIILTARTERQDLLDAFSAGADDFLVKPLDQDELRVRLLVAERIVGVETQLRQANDALRKYAADLDQASKVDALMRIGNRAAFEARLRELHSWAHKSGRTFGVVMSDIDHFKVYNDSLGHQRGDQILRQTADAVQRAVRTTDRAFRYGGEELALLLPDLDLEGAAQVAERVRSEVESLQFQLDGTTAPFHITISCGVASYPACALDDEDCFGVVARADRALYEAKRRGRNRVVRSDEMRAAPDWRPHRPRHPRAALVSPLPRTPIQ